jgi:hypothetical protein
MAAITEITLKELCDQIYDTLMQNVGMSEFHIAFDPSMVDDCFVSAGEGHIHLEIGNKSFNIIIQEEVV